MKNWLLEKRWRIILSGMVIVALPIIALSSFVYFVLIGHVRETVIEAEKNASIEIASHIQDRVRDDIRAGKLIASRPLLHKAIKSADRKELTSRLKSLVDNVVTIERAFITTHRGVALANYTVQLDLIGRNLSNRDWYKGVSKIRKPYVSEFYLRLAEPKRYLFSIAIPIKTERREVVGILVLQPEADYIKNALSHMPVIKGQKVYLIDKKGNLIYHSDHTVDRIIDFSGIPVVQKVLRGEDGIETMKQDGVSMVTAYHPIEELGWGVIVQRPEKEVLGHLRKINLAMFVFAGVMLLVGAYFATKRSDLLFSLRRFSDELEERIEERTGELKRAKKEWEVTFDAISDPIFIHDKEFRVIRANRAYQEASGMPFEEMIGRLYFEVFPKMEVPFKMCLRAMEDTDDKEEVYVSSLEKIFVVGFYPVRDKEGNYLYSAHIMEDITEEKRAMEALSESEEKFRTMTASAKDAIIMIGNEGEVVSWNNAAEKISGCSAGDAMGKELHMFFAPERYRAAYREGFRRFRETGEGAAVGKTLELAALRKDGTEFPVELSISGVKLKGKWNAIGILRDITERKQAEQKLKGYAEHLEEMVRARTKELEDANVELQAINKELDLRKAVA